MSYHGYFSDFLERFLKIVCSSVYFFCVFLVTHHTLKRCDGEKSICGPCGTHPRDDACEYGDGPEVSKTTLVEDTLSRVEARLLRLENHCAPDIILNSAYQHGRQVYRSILGLVLSSKLSL